jgi:hypothetical protein
MPGILGITSFMDSQAEKKLLDVAIQASLNSRDKNENEKRTNAVDHEEVRKKRLDRFSNWTSSTPK